MEIAVDLVGPSVVRQRVAGLAQLRADDLALGSLRLVDHHPDIRGLGKALTIEPHQAVTNLPSGILDRAGEPVVSPRAAEGQQQRTGLADPHDGLPVRDARDTVVPILPHEAKVRRAGQYTTKSTVVSGSVGSTCRLSPQ